MLIDMYVCSILHVLNVDFFIKNMFLCLLDTLRPSKFKVMFSWSN